MRDLSMALIKIHSRRATEKKFFFFLNATCGRNEFPPRLVFIGQAETSCALKKIERSPLQRSGRCYRLPGVLRNVAPPSSF